MRCIYTYTFLALLFRLVAFLVDMTGLGSSQTPWLEILWGLPHAPSEAQLDEIGAPFPQTVAVASGKVVWNNTRSMGNDETIIQQILLWKYK